MKKSPLTTAQKQSRRRAALDEIARVAGWDSWDQYATAVKGGIVIIAKQRAASRANGRKGGRPRKENIMTSEELANRAIKNLNGKTNRKSVQMAVLNACLESTDLVPQNVIDEATARVLRGISIAEKMKAQA